MAESQHEPTMEEILASIRKIISEDASAKEPAPPEEPAPEPEPEPEPEPIPEPEPMPEPEPEPEPAEDVLELTEVVEEPPSAAPEETSDDIDFATVAEEPAPVAEEPAFEEPAPAEEAPASDDGFFSEKSRQTLDDALSNIDQAIEEPAAAAPVAEPTPIVGGAGEREIGAAILNAVREKVDPAIAGWLKVNSGALIQQMKPIIREWLDENLPPLLTEAVREEVARSRGAKH